MNVAVWAGVAIAGAAGAAARYLVDLFLRPAAPERFPWGTTTVNVTGSFAAGALAGLAANGLDDTVRVVVAGGFLGAYTTFSTAMFQTVVLIEAGAHPRALVNAALPLIVGTAAALAGWALVT